MRRSCGGGIDNGSKRRIVLLALVRVSCRVSGGISNILLDHSSLEAVSGDLPLSLKRCKRLRESGKVEEYS